jgi:hypothetical protein
LAGWARADTLIFQFTGNVGDVFENDIFGDIAAGDLIQGSFRFDSTAPDLVPADPSTGSYNFNAPFGMDVTIGAHLFSASGLLNIGVFNGAVDQYAVQGVNDSGTLDMEMFLMDSGGTAFSDDHLPLAVPSLSSFDVRSFQFADQLNEGAIALDGTISAFSDPVATPEPSEWAALLLASLAMVVATRRRAMRAGR